MIIKAKLTPWLKDLLEADFGSPANVTKENSPGKILHVGLAKKPENYQEPKIPKEKLMKFNVPADLPKGSGSADNLAFYLPADTQMVINKLLQSYYLEEIQEYVKKHRNHKDRLSLPDNIGELLRDYCKEKGVKYSTFLAKYVKEKFEQ